VRREGPPTVSSSSPLEPGSTPRDGGAIDGASLVVASLDVASLDVGAHAAVSALARALELHDPAAARRAAYRAAVLAEAGTELELPPEAHRDALVGALVAEVALLVGRSRPSSMGDPAHAVLGASLLDRVPGLHGAGRAVRHQFERWDGTGGPHGLSGAAIPVASRLLAVATTLVGPLDDEAVPAWTTRAARVRSLSGTVLDPELADAIARRLTAHPIDDRGFGLDRALLLLDGLGVRRDPQSPLDALSSINAAVLAATHIDSVLSLVAEHARDALRADTLGIGRLDLADPNAPVVHVVVDIGPTTLSTGGLTAGQTLAIAERPAFTVFRSGTSHALGRHGLDANDAEHRYLRDRGAQSEIAVAVTVGNSAWGYVWATTQPGRRELDAADLRTLQLIADQLGTSIAQTQRLADLEQYALRDPLTGLGNRRVLDSTLRQVFARPPVARQDVALVMCDIDGLKIVNDTLGHSAGDLLLKEAANALRDAVEEIANATVCRIGGDEFALIIDGGGLLLGVPLAERAQALYARSGPGRSMSCGVAVAGLDVHNPGDLLRHADEAQYQQKHSRPGSGRLPTVPGELVGRRRAHRDAG
jgi:diguanylate cyclase (GGDEF)-like protein